MKFEEALKALRNGAKIQHPSMPEDEYYMSVRVSLRPVVTKPINIWEMPESIIWMKDGREHPEYRPSYNPNDPKTDPCKHGMSPMINLLWLMSEEWKVIGDME